MGKHIAVVLAGGSGRRLLTLSEYRAKPVVPFAGNHRIIDFALSNCSNSGIRDIYILGQYKPHLLWQHVDFGKPWGLSDGTGVIILQPHLAEAHSRWYEGNADAVVQNLPILLETSPQTVLILGGDHIYKMDYREFIEFHESHGGDVTVATCRVPPTRVDQFGICNIDSSGKIIEFEEKPIESTSNLASMGIYAFRADSLVRLLHEDQLTSESTHDFGADILPRVVKEGSAYAYEFKGYWRDVGTITSYYEANMDWLSHKPPINLADETWPIRTKPQRLPPASISSEATVSRALVCDGCEIKGHVESSILSPGVRIAEGAIVRNSILLHDVVIEEGAVVNLCVIDEGAVIGKRAKVGYGIDFTPNDAFPKLLSNGITLVAGESVVPSGSIIGRNCIYSSRDCSKPMNLESGKSL